tara:strand:- start:548 stop:1027 length:480 start_codon:yes stop_codon:yes gene_type:complete
MTFEFLCLAAPAVLTATLLIPLGLYSHWFKGKIKATLIILATIWVAGIVSSTLISYAKESKKEYTQQRVAPDGTQWIPYGEEVRFDPPSIGLPRIEYEDAVELRNGFTGETIQFDPRVGGSPQFKKGKDVRGCGLFVKNVENKHPIPVKMTVLKKVRKE